MKHIVKRRGHKEKFDKRKLKLSVYSACRASHCSEGEAEATANLVSREVKKWVEEKNEVSSDQIFKKATEELAHLNKDASFMYKTHRDIS